jgi:tRNA(Ile)-lysidine synthase
MQSQAPEAALRAFIERERIDPSLPALLGFSGGPDSAALLSALASVWKGPLRAVHVDHGIRPAGEREGELRLVRALCGRFKVSLTVARVRPGAIERRAASQGIGVEAAARAYRYHVFGRLLEREAARGGLEPASLRLFLAHNRDDQLETVLMRALGGAGTAGLRGIRAVSGPFLRPFLGLSKRELLAYLEASSIPYSIDSTNEADDYLRNRLRHEILPAIVRGVPGAEGGLLRLAEKAALEEEALSAWSSRVGFREGAAGLEAELALLDEPEAIRERAFLEAAGRLYPGRRVSSRLAASALAALSRGAPSYRGGGLELRQGAQGRLILSRSLDFPRPGGYFVLVDRLERDGLSLRLGGLRIELSWTSGPEAKGIREESLSFPFVLRSRRPGDRLFMGKGSKPLDELFSEWGIRDELRCLVPVVEDRNGIVAVLGSSLGARDRFRKHDCKGNGRLIAIAVKGACASHGFQRPE